ncbi:hypothetical protein IMZ31_21750 (plasmid) [Pontibacillus sp. ALD_SL1]|uniref:hypothetical protein n=1 Tax=Pontibacillus sp. ALD_SL1 TaxID=2777185 RepID=UPI001A978589|nr:hypothetical protein [Pontibacillus sp. ALD_SL1]QST02077.1 hypothetical protein IMZ31_21750 [Pontibacillus sp. ALD_SL1]
MKMFILLSMIGIANTWIPHGGVVQPLSDYVYVETAGRGEGAYVQLEDIKGEETYTIEVEVKGKGVVQLEVIERNGAGETVRIRTTDPLKLNDQWKGGGIGFKTSDKTKKVDVYVVSVKQTKQHFYMTYPQLKLGKPGKV